MAEPKFNEKRHYIHVAPGATAILQNENSFDYFAEKKREGGKLKEVEYLGNTPPPGYAPIPGASGRRIYAMGIDLKKKEAPQMLPGFDKALELLENQDKIAALEKSGMLTYAALNGGDNV